MYKYLNIGTYHIFPYFTLNSVFLALLARQLLKANSPCLSCYSQGLSHTYQMVH